MMTEEFKKLMSCPAETGHKGWFDEYGECMGCSQAHIEEFGNCVGTVMELTDYNGQTFEEYDVRWQPSNLRYSYFPKHLKKVNDGNAVRTAETCRNCGRLRVQGVEDAHCARSGGFCIWAAYVPPQPLNDPMRFK